MISFFKRLVSKKEEKKAGAEARRPIGLIGRDGADAEHNSDDFAMSMAAGAMTHDAAIGALVGGSWPGGIIGASISPGAEPSYRESHSHSINIDSSPFSSSVDSGSSFDSSSSSGFESSSSFDSSSSSSSSSDW